MSKQYRCCIDYVDLPNDEHIEESTIVHINAIKPSNNPAQPLWVYFVEPITPVPLEAFKFCFEEIL